MWYRRLREFLIRIKFKESYSDHSLFIYNEGGNLIYLFTYVDDIAITGSSDEMVESVIRKMVGEFAIRELGNINFFLGIHVYRSTTGIKLSQQKILTESIGKL